MVSRFVKGKWYDVLAFFVVVIVVCAAIQIVAPTSGLAQAIHTGFHFLALFIGWFAGGLIALANLLNQL